MVANLEESFLNHRWGVSGGSYYCFMPKFSATCWMASFYVSEIVDKETFPFESNCTRTPASSRSADSTGP